MERNVALKTKAAIINEINVSVSHISNSLFDLLPQSSIKLMINYTPPPRAKNRTLNQSSLGTEEKLISD